jgi:glycerophosphoryl diester phosphodiesterase
MKILAHRGMDLDHQASAPESSLSAFQRAAGLGIGLQMDLQPAGDELIVWQEGDLKRWTRGAVAKNWSELDSTELQALEAQYGKLCRWHEIIQLMTKVTGIFAAIHVKAANQNEKFFAQLEAELAKSQDFHGRLVIFGLTKSWAERLRLVFNNIGIAPTVAHPFDIKRFGEQCGSTLLTLEECLFNNDIFNWVWLDEWDRTDEAAKFKVLYDQKTMTALKGAGFQIALNSPELHRSEKHPDSQNTDRIERRWRDILEFEVDAICTDYPTRLSRALGLVVG